VQPAEDAQVKLWKREDGYKAFAQDHAADFLLQEVTHGFS
jgi:hypothetical protein